MIIIFKVVDFMDVNHAVQRRRDNVVEIIVELNLGDPTLMEQHLFSLNTPLLLSVFRDYFLSGANLSWSLSIIVVFSILSFECLFISFSFL